MIKCHCCHCEATPNTLKGCGDWGRLLRTGKKNKKCHSVLQERQGGGSLGIQTGQPNLIPGKMIEKKILLDAISIHTKEQKVIGSSLHSLRKMKLCVLNLIAFCKEMAILLDEDRTADAVYLDSRRLSVASS